MDKTLRSIIWILVALVVMSTFSTVWFFLGKERLYNDYVSLENLFKTSMDKVKTELASANKQKADLESKLSSMEKELRTVDAQHKGLKSKYDEALSDREYLSRELASVKKGKAFLEKKLRDMESDVFAANLLKEKVSLQVEVDRLKSALSPKDSEIEKLKAENMDKDLRLAKLQEEKNAAAERQKDASQVAEILSRDLLSEKDKYQTERQSFEKTRLEYGSLQSRITELEAANKEYNRLLADKEEMRARIAMLENDLNDKKQEADSLKIALADMGKEKGELRAEAYHKQAEVDLPPIVLNREPSQNVARLTAPSLEKITSGSNLKGRIVTVNREHNFVVIDIGRQDGVEVGNSFNVYRGEALLGTVEIIQARDRIAAADIKNLKDGLNIEINDTVIKR